MSAKYISSQEIEKLFLDGDYRIYVRQNKKWRWTGFWKDAKRLCEHWTRIYFGTKYIVLGWLV